MSTYWKCDKCGEDIKEFRNLNRFRFFDIEADLCPKCFKELKDFIKEYTNDGIG